MLARLKKDHKHIAILLNLLKVKYTRLADGKSINYNLIRDVVEYMQSYVEHSHHPLEDVINDYYLDKIEEVEDIDMLEIEHKKMAESSAALMVKLNLILSDIMVCKEELVIDLKAYVQQQAEHMAMEESVIFIFWVAVLDEHDWSEIQQLCTVKLIDDPLFSEDDNVLFEELRDYIGKSDELL